MKKLVFFIFGAFALSTSVQAAIYDFTAEGNNTENGYDSFVTGTDDHIGMEAGLTITASSSFIPDVAAAYLDANSGGPGGLGVCSAGDGDACDGNSDDNHSSSNGEKIMMLWDKVIELVSIKIIGNHVAVPGAVDSGTAFLDWSTDTQSGAIDISGANQTVFDLSLLAATKTFDYTVRGAEIYVMSLTTVPVPAAVWLFGTAMLGLFGMRRKAKMGAVAA